MSSLFCRLAAVSTAVLLVVGCGTCPNFAFFAPSGGSPAAWAAIAATNAPVRVAVYAGCGAGDESLFKLARLAAMCPDFQTRALDAEAIRRHALDDVDLLLMTGLDAGELHAGLGDSGADAIRGFVRRGREEMFFHG